MSANGVDPVVSVIAGPVLDVGCHLFWHCRSSVGYWLSVSCGSSVLAVVRCVFVRLW